MLLAWGCSVVSPPLLGFSWGVVLGLGDGRTAGRMPGDGAGVGGRRAATPWPVVLGLLLGGGREHWSADYEQ